MSSVRETWGRLSGRSRVAAVALPLVLVLGVAVGGAYGLGVLAGAPETGAVPSAAPSVPPSEAPLPPEPTLAPSASPLPTPSPTPQHADPLLGTDGRLTLLLLGSDYRPAHPGNRTDAILVVSVEPTSGDAAGFSIPRDTVDFPLPGGGRYGAKINGLYQYLHSRTGDGGRAMKQAVAKAYGIEVDHYVFIGFAGVKRLITAIGGVNVTLDKAYYDPYYWVTARQRGWGLPKGTSHLDGNEALIFARSRKGDNDFGRARRQQLLILATLAKVRKQGPSKLPKLLGIAKQTVRTDLPLDRANDLFTLVAATDISKVDRVVFGPRTYATGRGGSSFAPNLKVQRAWIKKHFPKPRPYAAWPAPSPSPSPSPSPTPSASSPGASPSP